MEWRINTVVLDNYTPYACYNLPLFKLYFFCPFAIISKYILSEIFCMLMDFSLTVFWYICKVMYCFGETILKKYIFYELNDLNVIFGQVLVRK